MSDPVETKEAIKEEVKWSLPPLDKSPKCFYDTEAKSMWVGIPVGYIDPFFASVYLDAAKLEFLKHTQRDAPAIIDTERRKNELASKVREGVGSMMSRLGGLVGK